MMSDELRMMRKISMNLPKPIPAGQDCLPHAAMNLGTPGGSSKHPASRLVSRIVIEPQQDHWILYRLDDSGGFVGDTTHPTLPDALAQVKKEFQIEMPVPRD